jgi:hypothetical protein
METPKTPFEFINNEPNLIELETYINNYQEEFSKIDTTVIKKYLISCQKNNNFYYLAKQIRIDIKTSISEELINKLKNINKNQYESYGGPCNLLELLSIEEAEKDFEDIQKIIALYYQIKLIEQYKPPDVDNIYDFGGELYQKVAQSTLVGKKL